MLLNIYSINGIAAMAQSVERRLGKAEVTGSIPVGSFVGFTRLVAIFIKHFSTQFEYYFYASITLVTIKISSCQVYQCIFQLSLNRKEPFYSYEQSI